MPVTPPFLHVESGEAGRKPKTTSLPHLISTAYHIALEHAGRNRHAAWRGEVPLTCLSYHCFIFQTSRRLSHAGSCSHRIVTQPCGMDILFRHTILGEAVRRLSYSYVKFSEEHDAALLKSLVSSRPQPDDADEYSALLADAESIDGSNALLVEWCGAQDTEASPSLTDLADKSCIALTWKSRIPKTGHWQRNGQ